MSTPQPPGEGVGEPLSEGAGRQGGRSPPPNRLPASPVSTTRRARSAPPRSRVPTECSVALLKRAGWGASRGRPLLEALQGPRSTAPSDAGHPINPFLPRSSHRHAPLPKTHSLALFLRPPRPRTKLTGTKLRPEITFLLEEFSPPRNLGPLPTSAFGAVGDPLGVTDPRPLPAPATNSKVRFGSDCNSFPLGRRSPQSFVPLFKHRQPLRVEEVAEPGKR